MQASDHQERERMIRSTRLVSLPESRLLIIPPTFPRRRHRRPIRCFADVPLGPTIQSPSYTPRTSLFSKRLVSSLVPSHPGRRDRPLPQTMDRAGDYSSGSDSSAAAATEDYVHVSSADPPVAVVAAEEAAPNPNPNIRADSELPEAPAWSSIEEKARASVAADDEVLGGLGGPDLDSVDGEEERKRVLPEELSKGVAILECESSAEGGTCDVYLVGTAHVSQESCKEVQAVISYLKPQVVFLELCSNRVAILTPQNLQVADKLEVFPGSEFRVAFEEAMSYGAKVILGDRPVHITLRRTWGKMTLWHRAKFLYYILFQAIFLPDPEDLNKMLKEMDDVDMLTLVIQEMSKAFPTLMETLLHERDMYMSSTLLKVAREHSSVVAVVGKGHLSGIKKHWKQPIEVKHLLEVPAKGAGLSRMKILASLGVAVTGVAIATGLYLVGKR
ncbi:traB domain-containing protein-like isoform X2 [Phoenix dactylifera]|uniref:TraB domain-containing protein-like isoform X2 n=1 Tax=Phoenix dactylifera TaxID=42345 RepID=A0A8B9A5D6_PHODC|nr:traB domain-containing protein-like isoform X2 [Phoenix dactylifera]